MYSFVKHLFHDIQPLLGHAKSPELLNFLQKLGGIFTFYTSKILIQKQKHFLPKYSFPLFQTRKLSYVVLNSILAYWEWRKDSQFLVKILGFWA